MTQKKLNDKTVLANGAMITVPLAMMDSATPVATDEGTLMTLLGDAEAAYNNATDSDERQDALNRKIAAQRALDAYRASEADERHMAGGEDLKTRDHAEGYRDAMIHGLSR